MSPEFPEFQRTIPASMNGTEAVQVANGAAVYIQTVYPIWELFGVFLAAVLGGAITLTIEAFLRKQHSLDRRKELIHALHDELAANQILLHHNDAQHVPLDNSTWQSFRSAGLVRSLGTQQFELLQYFYVELQAYNSAATVALQTRDNRLEQVARHFHDRLKGKILPIIQIVENELMVSEQKAQANLGVDRMTSVAGASNGRIKKFMVNPYVLSVNLLALLVTLWLILGPEIILTSWFARWFLILLFGSFAGTGLWLRYNPEKYAPSFAAILAAVATVIIAFLTHQQARDSAEQARSALQQAQTSIQQAEISSAMLQEMRLDRERQEQPFIYAWLEPSVNNEKAMLTIRNLGAGVGRTIHVTYSFDDESHKHIFEIIGPGQEITTATNLPLGVRDLNMRLSYEDGYGRSFNDAAIGNVSERLVPESEYSRSRTTILDQRQERKDQLLAIQQLTDSIRTLRKSTDLDTLSQ